MCREPTHLTVCPRKGCVSDVHVPLIADKSSHTVAYAGFSKYSKGEGMRIRFGLSTLLVVLVGLALVIPVPYLVLKPGPVFNTIGSVAGHDLITISGTQTFPTSGELNMTTVSEFGGPVEGVSIGQALWALVKDSERVVPREQFYDETQTAEQNAAQNAEAFSSSQSYAIAAAMNYLNKPVTESIVVTSITKGAPAQDKLRAGDRIVSLDGVTMKTSEQVVTAIRAKPVGTTFDFGILRDSVPMNVSVTTAAKVDDPATPEDETGMPYVGIGVDMMYAADFDVKFALDGVGGPSAGTMFAIGIVDKLTPGALTVGKIVAGTGTIDPNGKVGAIGGIAQKLVGARNAGAVLFLAPSENCDEVVGHIPDGLTVAPMSTLADGIKNIENFTQGKKLPSCEVK